MRPDELTPADAEAAYAAGVSRDALRDAATVCALFNMITRLADALGSAPTGSAGGSNASTTAPRAA